MTMILIDMHVHSRFSDGRYTPQQLAAAAKKRGLALLALTDHDTTSGLPVFMEACEREGVRGLCGIELSAAAPYTLHILGYRITPGAGNLEKRLEDIRRKRSERNARIFEKLNKLGIPVRIEEAEALTNGEVLARPHIAQLLVDKGYAFSIGDAFIKYLDRGAKAYVSRERIEPEECIALIREAGGVAVLAHPAQCRLDDAELDELVARLKRFGLWGIEAVYGANSPETTFRHLALAQRFGLYATAGSDFHGTGDHSADIGMAVSEDFLPWARLGVR